MEESLRKEIERLELLAIWHFLQCVYICIQWSLRACASYRPSTHAYHACANNMKGDWCTSCERNRDPLSWNSCRGNTGMYLRRRSPGEAERCVLRCRECSVPSFASRWYSTCAVSDGSCWTATEAPAGRAGREDAPIQVSRWAVYKDISLTAFK